MMLAPWLPFLSLPRCFAAALILIFTAPALVRADTSDLAAGLQAEEEEARPPAATPALNPKLFPVPDNLQPNVAFWTRVYAEHTSLQVLIHDNRHLDVVYEVLDLSEYEQLPESRRRRARRAAVERTKERYRKLLLDLAAGRGSAEDADERGRISRLLRDVPGKRSKYRHAASRLRGQTCLRDRFAEGIQRSGLYLEHMEEVFRERQLPVQLTRLPFVESLFQTGARSSAAAGGVWQFVPGTARFFLKMTLEYDERFDPHKATGAAASLLAQNYASLQSWPLAITAYNHGRAGMKRAVSRLGTRDLGQIVDRYRSRTFGFASRNFYSEFVAAAQVYHLREHYFPGVEPLPPLDTDFFSPDQYVSLTALAQSTGASLEELRRLNPALARSLWRGDLFLPMGYRLRVPKGTGSQFRTAYASLAPGHKSEHQAGFRHRVRRGESLSAIARKYGSSVGAIQKANRLRSAHTIRIGQLLLIPPRGGRALAVGSRSPSSSTQRASTERPSSHTVRRGQTLSSIAQRYGLRVGELKAVNGLRGDRIQVGQRLKIPSGNAESSTSATRHVVRSGETLHAIARRYGTTVSALKNANGLRNNLIRVAQVLVIPAS